MNNMMAKMAGMSKEDMEKIARQGLFSMMKPDAFKQLTATMSEEEKEELARSMRECIEVLEG